MAGSPGPGRDLKVDFWRGVALVMIFINHVPGNPFEHLTSRNYGISDSAELFVFLAGLSAALAYLPRFGPGEALAQSVRIWQRSWSLYLFHLSTTIIAVALLMLAWRTFQDPFWLRTNGVDILLRQPVAGLLGLGTMGFQLGYFNILPLYIALFAALPVMLFLAKRDLSLLLAASLSIYIGFQLTPIATPSYPQAGGWFFEPLAWQLLFVIGFLVGALRQEGLTIPYHPVAFSMALGIMLLGALAAQTGYAPGPGLLPLPDFLYQFNKQVLSVPRLVHALALFYVVATLRIPALDRLTASNPLARIGRHSLAVFGFGSVLAIAGQIVMRETEGSLVIGALFILTGLGALLGLATLMDFAAGSRRRREAREPAPALASRPASLGS
ncbi:OpgC family protein [Segnochrobactraceae bacterium EtOH-i3]